MKKVTDAILKHGIFVLLLLILTIIYFFNFYNLNLPAHDILTGMFPACETLKISLFKYGDFWPLWTPYGFSGHPFLLNPTFGFDSILGILLIAIPNTVIALKLSYVLSFLLAGITMYALMIHFKIENRFAFISSLIYVLNGYIASTVLQWGWYTTLAGYSILPLLFLFIDKAVKEKEWIKNSVIAGAIYSLELSMDPDMKIGLWFGLILGIYFLLCLLGKNFFSRLIKISLIALIIIVVFFGLSAIKILPSQEYVQKYSVRAKISWDQVGRQLEYKNIWNTLIEPIYAGFPKILRSGVGDHIGIIAFILLLFGIWKKWKNKYVIFFTSITIITIFLATNTFNLYYLLWKYVPFFGSMRYMDRTLFLFLFSASILAGFGAQELFKSVKRYQNLIYVVLITLIILNLGVFNYSHYLGDFKNWHNPYDAIEHNYILQNISRDMSLFRIQTWETKGIDWGTDFYNVPLRLEHIYRYDTLWYPPYMNYYLGLPYSDPNQDFAKFWGILNVKYITSTSELNVSGFTFIHKFPECEECYPETQELEKGYGPYLYRNDKFLPRAFIVNNSVLAVGDSDSVTQMIYYVMLQEEFDPSKSVIIRGKKSINEYSEDELKRFDVIILVKDSVNQNSIPLLQKFKEGGGRLLPDILNNENSFDDNKIREILSSLQGNIIKIDDSDIVMKNFDEREVSINADVKNKFLVYSEKFSLYDDGWNAYADKKHVEMYNADSVISAIYLDGNFNKMTFKLEPKSYTYGRFITIASIILVLLYLLYECLIKKYVKK